MPTACSKNCWGLYDGDQIVGFIGVMHQPSSSKNRMRCSRLVILPDYQGIGLGTKFLNEVSQYYVDRGYVFTIVTTAKNMIHSLKRSKLWIMTGYQMSNGNTKMILEKNLLSKRSRSIKTGRFKRRRVLDEEQT